MVESNIQEIASLREHIVAKITKHNEEIEFLTQNLDILDSLLKQSSFTKASSLEKKQPEKQETQKQGTLIVRGNTDQIVANAYVEPNKISIILDKKIQLDADMPPLKSFFINRIIKEMKDKDAIDVQSGKIQSPIECTINKDGDNIKEIIIENYTQQSRVKEIIKTVGWTLTRMLDNLEK